MRIKIAVPEAYVSPPVVDAALEAVTRLDEHLIRSGQSPTSRELVKQGAIWRPEDPGDEHFDHGGTIAARGWGDCDDWAPLHAATLRASGEDSGAVARVVPSGPSTYHAIVQRSDGSIDDPSIAAGMKPPSRVSGESIDVYATDPHDGRVYHGQLVPSVAPLSGHCGPGFAVRGCTVVGYGNYYEARCDVPMSGSPLMHVVGRRHPHRRHRRVPYGFSCTAHGLSPIGALSDAMCGAIILGDAAEMNTSLDRYKLLAVQASMSGASPGQVHQALVEQMTQDVQAAAAATGTHPQQHTQALLAELAAEGHAVSGVIVGDFFSDIGHAASAVVSTVSNVVNTVAKVANIVPWGDIIHGVQAAVSVVPGLGTAISNIVAAAETAYETAAAVLSGNPFAGALHAAYNFALASIPGADAIRFVLDPVVDALINLTAGHEPVETAVLNALLNKLPDVPNIGGISPRSIAASLAHMIVGHLGVKHVQTPSPAAAALIAPVLAHVDAHAPALAHAVPSLPGLRMPLPVATPAQHAAMARRAAQQAARARAAFVMPAGLHMTAPAGPKPLGVPHAVVHVTQAPALAQAQRMRPGSPGAPPGATHWHCTPLPGGQWQCQWR